MALEGHVFSVLVVGLFLALLTVPLEPWLRVGADPSSLVLGGEVSGPLVRWSGLRLLPVKRSGGLYYLFSKRWRWRVGGFRSVLAVGVHAAASA